MPDAAVASDSACSTRTFLPATVSPAWLSPLVPSSVTLTLSFSAGPLAGAGLPLLLGLAVTAVPGVPWDPGDGFGAAWLVKPPMTRTTTKAPACANSGTASFLGSSMTTGGIPSSPGSGAITLSRSYCSHHGLGRGLGSTRVVGSVALFCMAGARRGAAGWGTGGWGPEGWGPGGRGPYDWGTGG